MDRIFVRETFSDECKQVYDERLPPISKLKPKIVLYSQCAKEEYVLKTPFSEETFTISRDKLAFYVTFMDLVVVLCFLLFLFII